MTKAEMKNTAAGRKEGVESKLSPEMARLQLEYLSRCRRNSEAYNALEAMPEEAPSRKFTEMVRKAALGALRDVEYQIFATPIRTLADALFVIRLKLTVEGGCDTIPTHRGPAESANINAIRTINAMVDDDTYADDNPEGSDAWLSQRPYSDDVAANAMAAE